MLVSNSTPRCDAEQPPQTPRPQEILGHPKSGKTMELVRRAFQAAHQGQKTLLLSQNPVETSALQEKAWIEQQQQRITPQQFPLTVLWSHSLLEELVKALFPQLGYFTAPVWVHSNNTQPLRVEQSLNKIEITVPLAALLLTRPGGPTDQQFEEANFKFDSIFCDDATLQPGYIHDLLPKLLRSQGTLTQVRLRSNPEQLYLLRSDPSAYKKHSLSIHCSPQFARNNHKSPSREPPLGRWVILSLKKILLNEFEFAFRKTKRAILEIALALPLGAKNGQDFDLNYPWLETKRWRRYLLEHQERLNTPAAHSTLIDIAPAGLHPAAGSSVLTRELRGSLKDSGNKKATQPPVRLFCQPYFNLYGHYYDWLLLPYLDNTFLPKTEHRQMHYLWFLASRAKHTIALCSSLSTLPGWLTDPRHPTRRTLEKSIRIEIKT
jgi:hypothetical protein